MRAVLLTEYGSPPQSELAAIPEPRAGEGEVRLRVHAVGLGFPDLLMAAGKYQFKPQVPFTPGAEVAGVVTDVGPAVNDVEIGARCIAWGDYGALADYCVVPGEAIVRLPDNIGLATAAGFLVNYGTAYHALVQRGQLAAGNTLLVLGAAGGVGLAAVEIGKAFGARVIAAASTEKKRLLAKEHGADEAFDYTTQPIKSTLMQMTNGAGVDVVFDPVGGDLAEYCVRSMAWNGRYLVVGFAAGPIPAVPFNLPLLKNCSIVGVFWGAHTRREPQLHLENVHALFRMLREGKLRPHVTELQGLEQYPKALELLGARDNAGKIVIRAA